MPVAKAPKIPRTAKVAAVRRPWRKLGDIAAEVVKAAVEKQERRE